MTQNWLKTFNAFYTLPCKPLKNISITKKKKSQIVFHLVTNFDPIAVVKDSLYGVSSEDL